MKTLELKLKKDVFIVDIPIDAKNIYLSGDSVVFNTNKSCIIKSLNGNYKFLCKGSELTEVIASGLVNSDDDYGVVMYQNYRTTSMSYFDEQITALESFISAVESKGFHWLENPIKYKKTDYEIYADKNQLCRYISKEETLWEEAEEKTFRNPLIFVKNYVQ